jgi:predicted nucleic acid-binding protein
MAISAVTLAELSAGPHEVRPDTEQDVYFETAERARRLDVLQRAEHEFDPIPFDADATRAYGRVVALLLTRALHRDKDLPSRIAAGQGP